MLAGTLVTAIGLMPVGFAKSSAGEYAGNIFWVVMFALLTSWVVAVVFTPYMGVKLLPDIGKVEGGHDHIYGTTNYQRLRRIIGSRSEEHTSELQSLMRISYAVLCLKQNMSRTNLQWTRNWKR